MTAAEGTPWPIVDVATHGEALTAVRTALTRLRDEHAHGHHCTIRSDDAAEVRAWVAPHLGKSHCTAWVDATIALSAVGGLVRPGAAVAAAADDDDAVEAVAVALCSGTDLGTLPAEAAMGWRLTAATGMRALAHHLDAP